MITIIAQWFTWLDVNRSCGVAFLPVVFLLYLFSSAKMCPTKIPSGLFVRETWGQSQSSCSCDTYHGYCNETVAFLFYGGGGGGVFLIGLFSFGL